MFNQIKIGVVAFLLMLPAVAHAKKLTSGMENAARKLTNILVEKGQRSVVFESFRRGESPIGGVGGNFGPGIRSELMIAFEAVNKEREAKEAVTIANEAVFKIRGTFATEDDPDDLGTEERNRLLVVKVVVTIVDASSDDLFNMTFFLNRGRDIAAAEGLTIHLNPGNSSREDHKALRGVLKKTKRAAGGGGSSTNSGAKPTFVVKGSKIKTREQSPFAVELVTKAPTPFGKYQPRGVKSSKDVFPFVPIGIGEIYGVKVYNNSPKEIAVSMRIDGIDQFTFSEDRDPKTAKPRFKSWIIAPKSSFTIKGWHITSDKKRDDNLASFRVTKYGEGASKFAQKVDKSQVGVISVAIAHSHDAKSLNAKSSAETGFGPPIKQRQRVVKRKIDPPHEFIAIRYAH